jgi:hypothetical protein
MTNIAEPTPEMIEAGEDALWARLDLNGHTPNGVKRAARECYFAMRSAPQEPERLWLWKNFVDGKPEYWAFDNPFPTIDGGDPLTLGQPSGWAILKPSVNGRPDVPASEVEIAIKRVAQEPVADDDDAEWLRNLVRLRFAFERADIGDRLERIANRLQAPETGEE